VITWILSPGVEIEVANVDDKNWSGHYADPNPGSRSLLQEQPSTASRSTVRQLTIDSLGLKECALIKIDVEGMELEVLQGANDTITRFKPILYLENDRYEQKVVAFLSALHYDCYFHTPPLFNPRNFRGEKKNVFGSSVSVNLLCHPASSLAPSEAEGSSASRTSRTAQQLPPSYRPSRKLLVLPRMGEMEQKFVQMKTAVAMRPHDSAALESLGAFLMQRKEPAAAAHALGLFQRAINITQTVADSQGATIGMESFVAAGSDAYHNAGVLLHGTERITEAIERYTGALALEPTRTASMNNLAAGLKTEGRLPEAISVYERAIAVRPDYDKAHFNLAIAYEAQAKKSGVDGVDGEEEEGRHDRQSAGHFRQLADEHYKLAQHLLPPAE
jgi:tetratricopeptide (TPR) repeat protein